MKSNCSTCTEEHDDNGEVEDDQEEPKPSERSKERILFQKIKESAALRPFLDKYNMMDETDPEHTYVYLVSCIEK